MPESIFAKRVSRRRFIEIGAAAAAAIALPPTLGQARGEFPAAAIPRGVSYAAALPDLPAGAKEVISGKVWYGFHSDTMIDALHPVLAAYRDAGVTDMVSIGIDKGSIFLLGPDGKLYEFAAGERGVYHVAGGQLHRVLILRDLANGKVQLDTENKAFFDLPPEALEVLKSRSVAGEPGSDSPTLPVIRQLLTINGEENYDPNMLGQPALTSLNAAGTPGTVTDNVPWMLIAAYQNGHNIPQGTLDFMGRSYTSKAMEILGLPISDPYWMKLIIKGQPTWVLWQAFERGSITFNPQNPSEWQFEGGLAGNMFIASLNRGGEDLLGPIDRYLQEYHRGSSTSFSQDGVDYLAGTYAASGCPYRIIMNADLQNDVATLVAADGAQNGFRGADVVVMATASDGPAGLDLVWAQIDLSRYNGSGDVPRWRRIGSFGSQKTEDHVILYFVPDSDLPMDDEAFRRGVADAVARFYFQMTISGGDCRAGVLGRKPDHLDLISRNPFQFAAV